MLVHVTAGTESIITTASHPFYVEDRGWVWAGNLQEGDKLWLSDGNRVEVSGISKEYLSNPVAVYNFAVEDYHTYHVGNTGMLVYNLCQVKSGTDTVTYRRVQGGAGNQSSQQRVVIDSEGNVYINKKDRNLNISIDNGEHSQYYINNNRPGADIYEFEVPKWLDDMVKEYTIPQAGYKNNPLNQGGSAPKLTDPTTPGTCIEFLAPWIEWIEEYATNGRIISGGQ